MGNGLLFSNRLLDIVVLALLSAQTLKVIFSVFTEKRIDFHRFLDTGSMPSSHTASVVSLASAIYITEGGSSPLFALSAVFAVVVMYDAAGIRRAAGRQASVLNKIAENIRNKDGLVIIEKNLKELLGHTPLEVLGGLLLGIVIAILMC